MKKTKVNIITLGCSKNLVDSEVLMGYLKAGQIKIYHESQEPSDVVIINTCGFINDAKEESIDTILRYVKAKKDGLVQKVYVIGCLAERYKNALHDEINEVDGYYGVHDLPAILGEFNIDYRKKLFGERIITTPSHYAYLKISEGCSRQCSFCAIPIIRGKHVSKPIDEIVAEASWLAARGVKELILIAQDLTWYGLDLYKSRKLAALLEQLAKIDGIEWIRLHYAYPADFPMEILDIINNHDKICKYLDIPDQHISDSVLRSMHRGIDRKGTLKLLDTIREKVPGIAIRSTLIVGYPGETKQNFEELKEFVVQQRFDRLGVFQYSPEEDTPAFRLKDSVPKTVKQSRFEEIMRIQQEISLEKNRDKLGKILRVLVDKREGDFYIGRSEHDSPEVDNEILVRSNETMDAGKFYDITIEDAEPFDLYGRISIS